ncbi:MAG TPA: S-layer protein [Planctomycetaceae bacterium]|nr:S-layer protein [Planctomycetaceae bacterium]HCK55185.1 S-layer protein [Planctomycetaceae bacterium]
MQVVFAAVAVMSLTTVAVAAAPAKPKGLGDPGALTSLKVEPNLTGKGITVRGRDARQQLYVTAVFSSGQLRDHTHKVKYSAAPAGIIAVDETGLVTPSGDGDAVVTATDASGKSATLKIKVEGVSQQIPINFKNQIVPIFTKLGCNSGGCHGKASGQNGFKLSLLGFYPEDDYEFLVKEGRGRRLFPSAPGDSLLLQKAVGRSPHGGGKRMDVDSHEYRLIYRWVEQGMPRGQATDPVVVGIKCYPVTRVMDRGSDQQISTLATYSDGTVEDVTRMALYEANDTEMAEATVTGLIKTLDLAGEVAIMARYQGQVSTFRATIPLGADVATMPPVKNLVDEAVFGKLKLLGIPASPVADDATFLRRIYVDVTGALPSAEEAAKFLANQDPKKRDKVIDRLLDSPEYADYFTNKWNMVLRNKKRGNDDVGSTYAFYRWIWNSLYTNKPYDEFVREIIAASGQWTESPGVVWYREVDQVNEQVEDTAQLFLGLRIQCARCHHHPFEKWSQNDYYGFSAFFSRVTKKNVTLPGFVRTARDRRIVHNPGAATAKNPRSGQNLKPTGLGSPAMEIPVDHDPRQYLADWMARKDNPFFAHALVNRYWKHFFDRGIVEPEDDMRATNPPSNPELLNGLAEHFIANKFDLKGLVKLICQSNTYQLSSLPNDYNLKDKQNFSRYYPKRLTAEVLYDAFHQVTASKQGYGGLPVGTRAVQLPDPSKGPYFLKVFGQPQADTACECERSQEANLAQSLHLLNSSEVQNKIADGSGRAAKLAADKERSNEDKINELYRWVYSRQPDSVEMKIATAHLAKHQKDAKVAWEDIIWALINTKEFLFNH